MSGNRDLSALERLLEAMLVENENITARGVTRRSGSPFKHASDITRNRDRAALVESYREKQAGLRALSEKFDKQSRSNLTRRIAELEEKLAATRTQRDTLIASHRAMLLAVGEMGGIAAWKRFFDQWRDAKESLHKMGAMPKADVRTLPVQESTSTPASLE